ncbi:MAG TPA: HAMP domain-containing sensor histidine kinase [Gemmatimonadales bacterium]
MRRTTGLLALFGAAAVVGAEWMRAPGWILGLGVLLAATLAVWMTTGMPDEPPRTAARIGAVAALTLGASVIWSTYQLRLLERHWDVVREAAVTRASRQLGGELAGAVELVRGLAERAARLQSEPAPRAFASLASVVSRSGPSNGIVLFDPQGRPRAWAGVQRTALTPTGPELSVVTTPFYLWLVARRQTTAGAAVASLMLARSDDVPRAGTALTDRFVDRVGVGLRFLDPRAAPADTDVFDYVPPGSAAGDTLFAVQPVPPREPAAYEERLRLAQRIAALLILSLLLAAGRVGLVSKAPLGLIPAVAAVVVIGRAPLGATFGHASIFSSDTYSAGQLGAYSSSPGAVLLTGIVIFVLASALWRRGLTPSWPGRIVALVGTLAAPYILQTLANGITPPSDGVPTMLWARWQLALVVAAGALVLMAAAMVRGREPPPRAGWWPWVAGAIAIAAAILGLWLWRPVAGWPAWYPYVWAPALLLTLRPMPIRSTMATIAVVAGSSAALLTWGAASQGRVALAGADLEGLGNSADAPSVLRLERLVHEMAVDSAPRTAGDLFLLWRRSSLGADAYPAELDVWTTDGRHLLGLDLVDLNVSDSLVAGVARSAADDGIPEVQPVPMIPGMHAVAAIPVLGGRVVTFTVGPQSRLLQPSLLARFLMGNGDEPEAPYDMVLAPPSAAGAVVTSHVSWSRNAWVLRGERTLDLPGGPRHAHAQIDLRGVSALLQRGALLLVLDVAALALLWILVEAAAGRALPVVRGWWPRARRSLRFRLSVVLALFFLVPTVAFALWSFGRLEAEFRGARQLLIQRTLRDAAGQISSDAMTGDSALADAAQRVQAELLLSRDGILWATSAPVLADLGLADLLVPERVYARIAYGDEIELTADQRAAPAPTLVGFRLIARDEPGSAMVLASPEFLGDRALARREDDLVIALLLAGISGFVAAIVLSGFAAHTLAQPLQRLRAAALGVGAGDAPAIDPGEMPAELEPIRGALAQAAADVESGRRAQRVLAWGEVARQVAHEIKNPLTPIRLGIQHLLRLQKEKPSELNAVLPPTGERILAEIDRLDGIARAFSRFALPSGENVPVDTVDLAMVVRDIVQLYRMGEGATEWIAEAGDGVHALARRDELAEVLVNLCENARDAGATRVVIAARSERGGAIVEVRDDGPGISPDLIARVFEPRFSATTSGSGLGLAIAKRLVESWGGSIAALEPAGRGTVVRLSLRSAPGRAESGGR